MLKNKKLFLDSSTVFFDDKIDRDNGWETIVFNPVKLRYIKINPEGYKILRIIEENPGLNFLQLVLETNKSEEIIQKFIEQMYEENIILAE